MVSDFWLHRLSPSYCTATKIMIHKRKVKFNINLHRTQQRHLIKLKPDYRELLRRKQFHLKRVDIWGKLLGWDGKGRLERMEQMGPMGGRDGRD